MYGAMRAGIVPVPLNTKLGADTLEYTIRDAGCRAAVVDPAVSPVIVGVVDNEGLSVRIALDAPPAGWEDYDAAIAARGTAVCAAADRRRPSLVPALHVRLDRQAEGRRAHACRAALVDTLRAEILAARAGGEGARRGAALPQERHGGRHQAEASRRRQRRDPAELRAAPVPAGALRLQDHQGGRRAGGLLDASQASRPDREPRLLGADGAVDRLGSRRRRADGADRGGVRRQGRRELRADRRRPGDDRPAARRPPRAVRKLRRRLAGGRGEARRQRRQGASFVSASFG